jgi:hypothetical protein
VVRILHRFSSLSCVLGREEGKSFGSRAQGVTGNTCLRRSIATASTCSTG